MKIVVLSAFLDEITEITKLFPNLREITIAKRKCLITTFKNNEIVICLSGVGTIAAASTTTALCEGYNPDLIMVCGVAGGLNNEQKIGDLVLADKIVDIDLYDFREIFLGTPYEANCLKDPHTLKQTANEYIVSPLLQKIGSNLSIERLKIGTIVTSNIFPVPMDFFPKIKKLNCSAIEMESIAVFKAAEHYDIPVMTIRAISNLINDVGSDLGTASNTLKVCSERLRLFLVKFFEHLPELKDICKENSQNKITQLITKYNLVQHPEGGWYRQTFKSEDLVVAQGSSLERYQGESRVAGTSIIFLLQEGDYSAWHTVQSDETWNFHDGDPLILRVIDPNSGELTSVMLGLTANCQLQYTVKAGHLFSAESLGRYSITGCTVTPGFDFKDFKLIEMDMFLTKYSQHSALKRLIR